jgi:hypothetical protein
MQASSGFTDIAHGIQLAVAPIALLCMIGLCAFIGTLRCFLLEMRTATASLRFEPGPR